MAASLPKSPFLGRYSLLERPSFTLPKPQHRPLLQVQASVKFNVSELLGGRGLCNGEKGVLVELKRTVDGTTDSNATAEKSDEAAAAVVEETVPADGFEKELMGLTGGFPGGEKGLQLFIEKNPPPPKKKSASQALSIGPGSKKPKPPELPLLMPGMIAIVKNPNNPFYMYCGIVQRITDGRAGVLFEGGNWDRLITFRLDELERREKGPPMKNPKSAVLEKLIEKKEESS